VQAAATSPSTGADVDFGLGIVLLVAGSSLALGASRLARRKQ
jgi:hypothetical protein